MLAFVVDEVVPVVAPSAICGFLGALEAVGVAEETYTIFLVVEVRSTDFAIGFALAIEEDSLGATTMLALFYCISWTILNTGSIEEIKVLVAFHTSIVISAYFARLLTERTNSVTRSVDGIDTGQTLGWVHTGLTGGSTGLTGYQF